MSCGAVDPWQKGSGMRAVGMMTIPVLVLFVILSGCWGPEVPPLEVKMDMTLPARDAPDASNFFWVDLVLVGEVVQYRAYDKTRSEEDLQSVARRILAIDPDFPFVVDRVEEGIGQAEVDHLVSILKAAGATRIARRGADNQAVPISNGVGKGVSVTENKK